ncbi:MAG: Rrf2 family transcriptional regulator [candidate division Zixibacteria bacterium]|nr:Rrf2 family transcriptional regulator [candidate division Zixibacteria bacterium]
MQLSRKADYALRAVMHFAGLPKGKLASIGTVAKSQKIPREFLAKILKDLTWAGILASYQGVTGGYRLARPPKDVSFLNVIEAMEGPICLNLCCEGDKCECEHYKGCKMRDFWIRQQNGFRKTLAAANFAKYKTVFKQS